MNRLQRWFARVRNLWRRALAENASPDRFAFAVALGAVISAGPFWGVRAPLAIASAWATKLNRLTAVLASHILVVPIVIPVWAFEVRLGASLLGQAAPTWQGDATAKLLQIKGALGAWCLGALIVAPLFGALCGACAYPIAKRWQSRRRELAEGPPSQRATPT
jgi:uncharacterized protein (DUF2062 family)